MFKRGKLNKLALQREVVQLTVFCTSEKNVMQSTINDIKVGICLLQHN
jgi:hypothetical protein